MKTIAILTAWAVLAAVILFAVLVPVNAVMFQNPLAALSLGVIGLGLCMESKKHLAPAEAKA
jgi:hypothetical protein